MATAQTEEQKVEQGGDEQEKCDVKPTGEEKKVVSLEDQQKKASSKSDLAILNFVLKYLKFVGGALLIWFMGWLGLSYVWVICGLMIYILWRMNQEDRQKKRDSFREAIEHEKDVVEARMEDLPSWVRIGIFVCYPPQAIPNLCFFVRPLFAVILSQMTCICFHVFFVE